MFGMIIGLLPNIARLAMIAGIVGAVASFYWSWDSRGRKIERLQFDNGVLQSNLKIVKDNLTLREGEVEVLDRMTKNIRIELVDACEALWRAEAGKEEEAIDNILDAIRGIEDNEAH